MGLVKDNKGGLAAVLAGIGCRLWRDLATTRQHDAGQANVNARHSLAQPLRLLAHETHRVVGVARLAVLGGKAQNLRTLDGLADGLTRLVLISPR